MEPLEQKRGYLKGDFEFFHIKDKKDTQFEYHYHDFNKIVIFISGNVNYLIEGKSYKLKPWDFLLISAREIHKPIIDPDNTYERIVIWLNQDFLDSHNTPDCNLSTCFESASKSKFSLLRFNPELIKNTKETLALLENAQKSKEFGSSILKNAYFLQLIVQINREFLGANHVVNTNDIESDERINNIISYINEHLGSDLSIEKLSSEFFLSKYYLMHKFKLQTGFSIHSYVTQKRLIKANELIKTGKPSTTASLECGFEDYSSFVRAFKKQFGLSPKKHAKNLKQNEINNLNNKEFIIDL